MSALLEQKLIALLEYSTVLSKYLNQGGSSILCSLSCYAFQKCVNLHEILVSESQGAWVPHAVSAWLHSLYQEFIMSSCLYQPLYVNMC